MKILLTGYKGFIGKNFKLAFESADEWSNDVTFEITYHEKYDSFPKIEGLDWVIHIGGESSTKTSLEDAMKYNYEFSTRLYDECVKHNVNLQWASSASVYGNDNTTFKETDLPNPQSPYAWSKYLTERYIEQNPSDIIVQGFRYFNVHGKYEDHKGLMASPQHQFTQQALKNKEIKIFEDSDKVQRDFIHVAYVIQTHLLMIESSESGVWNVGTGLTKTFQEVAMDIQELYNVNIRIIPFPKELKLQYQWFTKANMEKLEKSLKLIGS